jgi:uncharacterized membrane protein YphA (DoxX/SURF4 family)
MINIIKIYTAYAFQIILAVTLINVWLVNFSKATKFRGKGAHNMKEEFKAYGLPSWLMYTVGLLKIIIALLLLLGFWAPVVLYPAGLVLAVLMLGAVFMHIKVRDSIIRILPAIVVFFMALVIMFY